MQHWFFLISAILLEVAGTTAMKFSEGFTKIVPSILMAVLFFIITRHAHPCLKEV